ncbi:zf-HC2 domain-containing protein [Streptomyces sp. LP05-1]|uniref:Zf-HC2 domain-containing protein n=1 Tax=Streptomyces pyxinae TaxID=2970734 RepID=A0ABT2CLF8_9ACTN|nr:zf-HC2 domain-containing protein [Streptomyces sp. LP05-1]MCS0637399.1 zf-HC2 domain-containing protein [Streptomyces sp. LP05-1]
MSLRERHQDVAAHALGLLEPADALACEEHLARCLPCAGRLAGFAVPVAALAQLAGRAPLEPLPGVRTGGGRGTGAGGRGRGRRGRRGPGPRRTPVVRLRPRLVAAVAAVAVAVPGAVLLSGRVEPAAPRPSAAVTLRDRPWGTEVALRMTGVTGPRVCELVVVGADGSEQPVLTWGVYGAEGAPVLESATALRRAEIDRLEVRSADDGEPLVTWRP